MTTVGSRITQQRPSSQTPPLVICYWAFLGDQSEVSAAGHPVNTHHTSDRRRSSICCRRPVKYSLTSLPMLLPQLEQPPPVLQVLQPPFFCPQSGWPQPEAPAGSPTSRSATWVSYLRDRALIKGRSSHSCQCTW